MLTFFYKHQKKIVGFLALGVICSGMGDVFIRSPRTFGQNKKYKKRACKILSSRKLSEQEWRVLKRFFSHEAYPFSGNPRQWNFLNEGILTEKFLTKKLGEELFLKIYGGNSSLFDKERGYSAYRRFDAPFISSEEVWKSSAPHLYSAYTDLQQVCYPVSPEGYAARVRLFLEEKKFPHYVLRQMLEYRRRMFNLPEDVSLSRNVDLRLFGYKSVQDWFGAPYIDSAVEALLRFAEGQRKNIPYPSFEEAKNDFYDKAKRAFARIQQQGLEPLSFDAFVMSYFHFMEMEEREFLNLYREILLCKRAFLALEGSIAFDFCPLQDFFSKGRDSIAMERISLHDDFCFKNKAALEVFETYVRLAYAPLQHELDLPRVALSKDVVKAREPSLIGRRFSLSYRKQTLQEMETQVSMAEVHQWMQQTENFETLQLEFPELETKASAKDLQGMKPAVLNSVYAYIRREVLRGSPSRIAESIAKSSEVSCELVLSPGEEPALPGIQNGQELGKLLLANGELSCYSQDQLTYYSLKMHSYSPEEEVLNYRDIVRKGLGSSLIKVHGDKAHLAKVLHALRDHYPNVGEEQLFACRLGKALEEFQEGSLQAVTSVYLQRKMETLFRGDAFPCAYEEIASLSQGESSPILIDAKGPFCCISFGHRECDVPAGIDKLFFAKSRVEEEVLGELLSQFFDI